MICPRCRYDYKDRDPEKPKSRFYHSNNHFYKKQRRYGYQCGRCNFIAEIISAVTGDSYLKKLPIEADLKRQQKRSNGKVNLNKNKQRSKTRCVK